LATFAVVGQGLARRNPSELPTWVVPYDTGLNPPLWELGHVGWFQDHWVARNPQRHLGHRADPLAPRGAALRSTSDAWYDSSRVAHAARWQLPLPDAQATCADLELQLERTLAALHALGAAEQEDDDALYFFRLVLAHEDMHHEAAVYMAQHLQLPVADAAWRSRHAPPRLPGPRQALALAAGEVTLGWQGPGFCFDNEAGSHRQAVASALIDSQVITWAEFLPFVEAGGYRERRWWSEAGWAMAASQGARLAPAHLRRHTAARLGWQQQRFGHWCELAADEPACHISAHEAQAWCAWAGRRLPTEAEWQLAATQHPQHFHWGAVWEWTASPFAPYPGFVAHPYRDYSQPWFHSRPVLRGASFATQARMRSLHYRNYFTAERTDVFTGFRTCASD
jgi:gamma-glutamyl hercynylcysteine S-oxide synthase